MQDLVIFMEVFLYIVVGFMLAFYGLYSGATPNEGAAADADAAADAFAPADFADSYGGTYGGEQLQRGARRALRTGASHPAAEAEGVEDQVSELWEAALPPISPQISPYLARSASCGRLRSRRRPPRSWTRTSSQPRRRGRGRGRSTSDSG